MDARLTSDRAHRRRPTSRGRSGSLWAAVRRLARGNDADYAPWDDEHEDDHLSRHGPIYVTTFGATWRALRPYVEEHAEAWSESESEWGRKLREAADARRAARRGKDWRRMPVRWAT